MQGCQRKAQLPHEPASPGDPHPGHTSPRVPAGETQRLISPGLTPCKILMGGRRHTKNKSAVWPNIECHHSCWVQGTHPKSALSLTQRSSWFRRVLQTIVSASRLSGYLAGLCSQGCSAQLKIALNLIRGAKESFPNILQEESSC